MTEQWKNGDPVKRWDDAAAARDADPMPPSIDPYYQTHPPRPTVGHVAPVRPTPTPMPREVAPVARPVSAAVTLADGGSVADLVNAVSSARRWAQGVDAGTASEAQALDAVRQTVHAVRCICDAGEHPLAVLALQIERVILSAAPARLTRRQVWARDAARLLAVSLDELQGVEVRR